MKILFIFLLALTTTFANAAGPLFVEGTLPVKYKSPNIVLNFDLDMLAVTLSNDESDMLVLNAFGLWNDVTINLGLSTINLTQGADLSVDIDDTNYFNFIPLDSGSTIPADDGLNPVIYDTDGKIIDAFFGLGQSDLIAGFAASSFFVGETNYTEGYAVINGKDLGLTITQTTLLVAHEIGHFIGLDHSLVDVIESISTACSTKPRIEYPLMYPFVCKLDSNLHQDDIISVATLYPSADINQQLGQITGKFVNINGDAILGANIYAVNTTTNAVYSVVSDFLTGGTGFFSMYLPAGTYTLHANSINPDFNGASGAGPYADDSMDVSFQAPHPITAVNYEGTTLGMTETLTVVVSQATDVMFKLDGSGTTTNGSNIIIPTAPNSGGGDSGSMAPTYLMLVALLMYLRTYLNRKNKRPV